MDKDANGLGLSREVDIFSPSQFVVVQPFSELSLKPCFYVL